MKRHRNEYDGDEVDGDIDDDEIWASICQIAGEYAGVSAECAKSILEEAGQIADDHIGIKEAIETVLWTVRRKSLPPER
jgi:hypothetical protein